MMVAQSICDQGTGDPTVLVRRGENPHPLSPLSRKHVLYPLLDELEH